jgi:DNA repair exonuclease SbcCD ATPase subunit
VSKPDKQRSEIVHAAEALEEELAKLETLSRAVRKIRLDSEKNISRAARELNEAVGLPERLSEKLQALASAMQGLQERQQAALEPLALRATEIQQRMQRLGELMAAFALLGKTAGEVTSTLQSADARSPATLEQVASQLTSIVDGARVLFEQARVEDFPEVAREADALKQRIAALRGKLPRSS